LLSSNNDQFTIIDGNNRCFCLCHPSFNGTSLRPPLVRALCLFSSTLCILYVLQVKILIVKDTTSDLVCLTLSSGISPTSVLAMFHWLLFNVPHCCVGKNESAQTAFVKDTAYGNLMTSVFLRQATLLELKKGTSKAIEEYCKRADIRGWSSGNLHYMPRLSHYRI
jgi:hypothetical protein